MARASGPRLDALPDELLSRILAPELGVLSIERWTELATVSKALKAAMQRLVPAEFVVRGQADLAALASCSVKVGGIAVESPPRSASERRLKACDLQQLLAQEGPKWQHLAWFRIHAPGFLDAGARPFLQLLPRLPSLAALHMSLQGEQLPALLQALPVSMTDLSLRVRHAHTWAEAAATPEGFQGLARLTQLQSLALRAEHELRASRQTLRAHAAVLAQLLRAGAALLGVGAAAGERWAADGQAGGSRRRTVPRQAGEQLPQQLRVSRMAALAAGAHRKAEVFRSAALEHGTMTTDCLHVLGQALQWQLALALAMQQEQLQRSPLPQQLQALWQAADLGPHWLDLRPLRRLSVCCLQGLPAVWLPPGLTSLQLDSWGYAGPLPASLEECWMRLVASAALTSWEVRPLGMLPLRELDVAIRSSKERCRRDFCFAALQGAHSLQLYARLRRLSLATDRDLHLDAQMGHHLLSLLAQRGPLRRLCFGSGAYRLQGEPAGKGVAALNLLSDLKDHCGWRVQQHAPKAGFSSLGASVAVTVCEPPAPEDWPFPLQEPARDFFSDFE